MSISGLPPLPDAVAIREVESSFGELGGCPVRAGSTGNIATEDLVSMRHEMGVDTGIDLDALLAASRDVQAGLGRSLGSHLLTAGPVIAGHGAQPPASKVERSPSTPKWAL